MEIENEHDDKTETGQSFHNNQHTIVNFETYKIKWKVSDRRKFEKANFDEFESALNNKNDLVHCPSITLFESIPTEVRSFYRRRKSGLIKVFLTFVEDEPDFPGRTNPFKVSYSQEKINLMVYTLFQVHTLKFQVERITIPFLFYLNRGY
ncbi:CFF_collapsed_G0028390.mRNA.1.CDS.1 [Saccharomyces cerevisiae]|nr:CFF_collapsed_G0028390.mRNA.1.CDS.1 [Saccharomyces cerevisiae]